MTLTTITTIIIKVWFEKKKGTVLMYYVYILRCEDNTLYTGITTDVKRRFSEHMQDKLKGAKYTRAHKPKEIAAVWETGTKSDALKLEYCIKKLEKIKKEKLILNTSEDCKLCGIEIKRIFV